MIDSVQPLLDLIKLLDSEIAVRRPGGAGGTLMLRLLLKNFGVCGAASTWSDEAPFFLALAP
jgi:hypothetical protein